MPIANNFTKLEIYGKKAILQINRPDALNSLNQQVLQEIHENCLLLQNNKEITVVIVCGSGEKAFVAGADIKEMQAFKSCESAQQFSQNGSKAFLALENLPQITIARIQGFALGGGLELALACDFIIASEKARFGLPEVTLGLIPGFGGTQRLARRIGTPRALEWITSAEKYSATEAYGYGLINHVTKHEDLISFTEQMTEKILKNSPHAVRIAKQVVKLGLSSTLEAGCAIESNQFGLLFTNPEAEEGLKAFIEKRPAKF